MRQRQNNFRQSIQMQEMLYVAKTQPTIVKQAPPNNTPTKPVVESKPEPKVKAKPEEPKIEPIVEEVKPVEQPKVEQIQTTTTTTQTTRLPKI